ncbi:MAG: thermonuclease family protein [Eubacteriales bacterium]|nr:thermonuclease family protein [Eubacteriales bacterium]MDY3333288.1 thermonuclease family protein [Gallibacter sp.]
MGNNKRNITRMTGKKLIGLIIFLIVGLFFGKDGVNFVGKIFNDVPIINVSTEIKMPNNLGKAEIIRVKDGDTFVCKYKGKKETVRLIGVDTPESVHPDQNRNSEAGKKASEITKEILLEGSEVFLEFDVAQRDKYGRILAYVYLEQEGNPMLNVYLLEKGYAKLMTVPPNVKYVEKFKKIAKQNRKF